MTIHDLVVALLGVVAGLVVQGIGAALVALHQYTRQEFSGTVYAVLPPSGGKAERIERMRIRQHRQRIQVRIRRVSPPQERGRRWKMVGYTHGNLIVGTFSTLAPRIDPSSYGVIVLHRDPTVTECGVWRGYYVRPDLYGIEAITSADSTRYPLVWQQVNPEVRNYGAGAPHSLPALEEPSVDIASEGDPA
jgi:hypothetical protein